MTENLKTNLLRVPNSRLEDQPHLERIIKSIKETLCHVSLDFEYDLTNPQSLSTEESSFELPDGSILQINRDIKYQPAEIMFNPIHPHSLAKTIPEMLLDTLDRCDGQLINELIN